MDAKYINLIWWQLSTFKLKEFYEHTCTVKWSIGAIQEQQNVKLC